MDTHMNDSCEPTLADAATQLLTPEERSKMQQNVTEARIAQAKYLRNHKEVDEIFAIALSRLLREQPADAERFLTDFFADNDLEALVEAERRATAEQQRVSAEAGREKMKTLF